LKSESEEAEHDSHDTSPVPVEIADIELREIYVLDSVSNSMAVAITKSLRRMEAEDPDLPITIVINSCGGEDGAGWAIFDAIQMCTPLVIGHVIGNCFSIATLILQACDVRALSKHCRFMVHCGSVSYSGPHQYIGPYINESNLLNDQYYTTMAQRAKMKPAVFRRMCEKETFLSAVEAVEANLADTVILPRPRKRLKKVV